MFKRRKDIHSLSEAEIITLAKEDHQHFGVLYEKYFEQIFRFVFKRLGGDEEASGDITQQTFLKAMANLHRYEDRGLVFGSWLYRIAQNEVNLFFRNEKRVRTIDVSERQLSSVIAEADLGSHMSLEDQEKLMRVINALEPAHLDLIELRFFQGMSFREISDIYSISEANAKMRVYRILEKINKAWSTAL